MAYYDHGTAEKRKKQEKEFEKFFKELQKNNLEMYYYIHEKLHDLEDAEKKIEEYKKFFSLLKSFMPDMSSSRVFK